MKIKMMMMMTAGFWDVTVSGEPGDDGKDDSTDDNNDFDDNDFRTLRCSSV